MISPGQQVGPYSVLEKIGEGGMGAVYTAKDASIGRTVVLKVLSVDLAGEAEMLQRFHREVEMITGLEHPHILPVYDFGEVGGDPYITMRYIGGGSLLDHMDKSKLSQERLLRIFDQVAEALDFAHDRDVIHRDLKPANVLLDESGNAYLADFGLAKTMQGTRDLTKTGSLLGTPAYMSPEQVRGEKLTRQSDVYSFAVMAFEAFSGHNPFKVHTPMEYVQKHLREAPRSISTLNTRIPESVDRVLQAALAKDPATRPARATEFMSALRAAFTPGADAPTVAAPAPTRAAPKARRRRLLPFVLLASLGAALALAAVGILAIGSRPEVHTYPVGDSPRALLAFDGSIWVANFFDNTLARLTATDCESGERSCGQAEATYLVPDLPVGLAHDGSSIWIASALDQSLTRLDPSSGEQLGRFDLPNVPSAMLYAQGHLWIANEFAGTVSKLDLDGTLLGDYPVLGSPRAMLWDGESLWVASEEEQAIAQVDPADGTVLSSISLEGAPVALAFDGGHLWAALSDPGQLLKLDRTGGAVVERLELEAKTAALLFDGANVWAADSEGDRVIGFEATTGREVAELPTERGPIALAWISCGEGCGDLWVANEAADSVSRVRLP